MSSWQCRPCVGGQQEIQSEVGDGTSSLHTVFTWAWLWVCKQLSNSVRDMITLCFGQQRRPIRRGEPHINLHIIQYTIKNVCYNYECSNEFFLMFFHFLLQLLNRKNCQSWIFLLYVMPNQTCICCLMPCLLFHECLVFLILHDTPISERACFFINCVTLCLIFFCRWLFQDIQIFLSVMFFILDNV